MCELCTGWYINKKVMEIINSDIPNEEKHEEIMDIIREVVDNY